LATAAASCSRAAIGQPKQLKKRAQVEAAMTVVSLITYRICDMRRAWEAGILAVHDVVMPYQQASQLLVVAGLRQPMIGKTLGEAVTRELHGSP